MIVLTYLDIERRHARFQELPVEASERTSRDVSEAGANQSTRLGHNVGIDELLKRAREVGCVSVEFYEANGRVTRHAIEAKRAPSECVKPEEAQTQPEDSGNDLSFSWSVVGNVVTYTYRVPHQLASLSRLSAFFTLATSTYGRQEAHLLQTRLALYEICANVLEHGRPRVDDAELRGTLRLEESGISGWIQDNCEFFDTLAMAPSGVTERIMQNRARGYGLHMIRQLLDDTDLEYNDSGNRIQFKKEILR